MRLAILFSGQGNQQPLHLEALRRDAAGPLSDALVSALGALWSEPAPAVASLQANRIAQPLIFGSQLNLWRQLAPRLPRPVAVAGYSLGEMAACCVAGCFAAEAGVELCVERARRMDACVNGAAGLLAVIGLGEVALRDLADECGLAVAIRNGPDHLVLGGPEAGLLEAATLAEACGASRVVRLGVTTPSHTHWLAAASADFAETLRRIPAPVRLPFPVFSAIDGRAARNGPAALVALARQISSPLDWAACLAAVAEMQPDAVLEIGPGNALARMWAEQVPAIPVRASDDFRSVDGIVDWLARQG